MGEFEVYEASKRSGTPAATAYKAARMAGMADIDAIRMLRTVYGLTLSEAKEAMIVGGGIAESLDSHEAALLRALQGELDE